MPLPGASRTGSRFVWCRVLSPATILALLGDRVVFMKDLRNKLILGGLLGLATAYAFRRRLFPPQVAQAWRSAPSRADSAD